MYYDPFDRDRRERRQRRMAERERRRRLTEEEAARRQQAAQLASRQQSITQEIIARFEEELARARRERDEWADRYENLMKSLDEQQDTLAAARKEFEAEVEQQREALQSEAETQHEQVRAEAEAQRERLNRNAEQRAFEENRKMILRMLEVADNLERALAQVSEHEASPVVEGLRLTHRDFQRALRESGVEKIESVGQPFDPALHEAVASQESQMEADTILNEVTPGYLYRGTLLRPAKVIIAT